MTDLTFLVRHEQVHTRDETTSAAPAVDVLLLLPVSFSFLPLQSTLSIFKVRGGRRWIRWRGKRGWSGCLLMGSMRDEEYL
jgi:hypothetical protein